MRRVVKLLCILTVLAAISGCAGKSATVTVQHEGLAADSASRALEQLRRYAGLSASEYRNLATQMGVTTRVSEKAGTSLGALAKQAAVATAAYMSLRTAASLVSQTFADFRDYQSALVDMPKVTDQDLGTIDAAIKAMHTDPYLPANVITHFGVVIGINQFIHQVDKRRCEAPRLTSEWRPSFRGFYRWRG